MSPEHMANFHHDKQSIRNMVSANRVHSTHILSRACSCRSHYKKNSENIIIFKTKKKPQFSAVKNVL